MEEQKVLYESGNELAAYAAKQINYHVNYLVFYMY